MSRRTNSDTEDQDISARLYAAGWRTLSHLEAQIAVVETRLRELPAGGFDEEVSRAGAALARALKECSGELRQLEKHDRRMTMTPEQRFAELIKYLRTLSAEQLERAGAVMDDLRKGRAA